jgi:FKBP-type peptidyl-prolyl cis-trans isomerase SlyD
MKVSKDKVISLTYELRVDGKAGEIIETVREDQPLSFIFGNGSLLPKFESNIDGMVVGDSFEFLLKSVDAYGDATEDALVDVPKQVFVIDGEIDEELLTVGNAIPMQDSQGNRLNGIVVELGDETVKMDFNHPLAGDDLYFKGSITGIREATEEELTHGHVHSGSSCNGCDCEKDHGDCGGHC